MEAMKIKAAQAPFASIRTRSPLFSALFLMTAICAGLGCSFKPANAPQGAGTGGSAGSGGPIGGGGGTTSTGPTDLSITPATATLSVSNVGPAQTQQYTVTGTVNGATMDLTTQVTYSVTPTGIVTIDGAGLATTTGTGGGTVTVTARSGSTSASATLIVNYSFTGVDPSMTGVPADAGTRFTSTTNDTTRAPQLIYPNNGVLFPPNISSVEIHFMPGANNTLFEVSFTGATSSVTTYIRCTTPTGITGCVYLPDPGLWRSVASVNAGKTAVQLMVRGTDDTGTSVGASQTFSMQFAQAAVEGALYYWTTSGKTAIMRYDFGGSTTTPAPYLTPTNAATASVTCIGCHALSPDGSKLVASAMGQGDGRLLLWDVANNVALRPFALAQRSQFESWNKDGTQFVGVFGDNTSTSNSGKKGPSNLMIFDGTSGAVTQTIDLMGLRADHPDWSKNTSGAESIAFTSADPTATTTDQHPSTGGIDFIQLTGTTWGPPQVIIPSQLGQNNYYPAISPDGTLLVYDQSTCTAGTPALGKAPDKSCNGDTDATATMYLAPLAPNATPVPLGNANGPGVADAGATALTNSFPKWAPFVEQLDELNQILWLTFSSTRQYGLRSPPAPAGTTESNKGTLIWMVGIRLGVSGGDPSFTAFALPFQDITTSNHIAQWAKTFVVGPG
jgi:hypothetical protein